MSIRIGILRHAIAEEESPSGSDFDRRLTPGGRLQLEHHLAWLISYGWQPTVVLHSPAVRTTQTAGIVGAHFPDVPLIPTDVVMFGDLQEIVRLCAGHTAPLIVGHEPTMGELVAHLIGSPPGTTQMKKAGFALVDVNRLPTTRPARLLMFAPPRPGSS